MKLTDIWETKQSPTISFELFPARSPKAAKNLEIAIDWRYWPILQAMD